MGQIEWPFTSEDFILSFFLIFIFMLRQYNMFRIKGLNIGKLDLPSLANKRIKIKLIL